jgi:hypothetical protein
MDKNISLLNIQNEKFFVKSLARRAAQLARLRNTAVTLIFKSSFPARGVFVNFA